MKLTEEYLNSIITGNDMSSNIGIKSVIQQILENQEIIKKLKEWNDKVNKLGWDDADVPVNVFQKILEREKI